MHADGTRSEDELQSWLRFLNEGTQLDLTTELVCLARGKIDVEPCIRDVVHKRYGTDGVELHLESKFECDGGEDVKGRSAMDLGGEVPFLG